ncbi:MAG: alpha-glucan family phosphorylase [Gammaproteobacteria bacterium]|nr:alpha-glucan family phosphorylase [Gammaproteobacteria bacterium]
MTTAPTIAYFSMEIGLEPSIPTYSGGLGMLAGDTIRSAADMGLPEVVVSLLHRKGYFHQRIDETGWQTEQAVEWAVNDYLEEMPPRVIVEIENRKVQVRAWKYNVAGAGGENVPVYLLDTDIEGNAPYDRTLTHYLYGGDDKYRLCQEMILGIGGIRMLRALGCHDLNRYHMNEGHASLLVLELLTECRTARGNGAQIGKEDINAVRRQCVFTTHTPVPAGHDQFNLDLVHQVFGRANPMQGHEQEFCCEGLLNLTYLALESSHFVNGVSKEHREVSQQMFAGYRIESVTNGIHVATWASKHMQELFDHYIPGWREDNASLRSALSIPRAEIWQAHQAAKKELLESGSDLWLNTPQPPLEASGTSGMKAAANGVPSFSILDGWWIEGCIEGITGWAVGDSNHNNSKSKEAPVQDNALDAQHLYHKLEEIILPLFYQQQERYIDVMRHAIALNGSFFNTERMLNQYVTKAYFK